MKTSKYIIRKIIIGVGIALCLMFIKSCNVHAYVVIQNTGSQGDDRPVLNQNAINNPTTMYYDGITNMGVSPWLFSLSQYWYQDNLNGNYMYINADYSVRIDIPQDSLAFNIYNNDSRNTLIEENLRCAVDGLGYGYDGTYQPEITNFNVTFNQYVVEATARSLLIRVRFNYKQQLSKTYTGGYNMSCWFDRIPSNGLFTQIAGGDTNGLVQTWYYNNRFDVVVSVDQLSAGLNGIQSSIDTTNDKLDDLNKNLTDETSPNLNGLENAAGWLKPGPVDSIINLPLTLLNNLQTNLGNTCNPVVLTLPYIDKDITLPCVSALYKQIDGLDVWFQGVGVIAAAVILYKYFIYLYKKVDDTLTLRENTMEGYFDESLWGGM